VKAADVIITMGCGDTCPIFPGNATRTGSSTTPPVRASRRSVQSGTRSSAASATSSRSSP